MINEVRSGDGINAIAKVLNELVRAHNAGVKISVGPGLTAFQVAGKQHIALSSLPQQATGAKENNSGGTPDDLDQTQGVRDADNWDRDTDKCPVTVKVITDIKYDTSNGQLTFRTRLFHYDKGGNLTAIDAESDPITLITTAIVHPGS